MKVQCLIPKYNNGKYFEQTLLSLINQTVPFSSILISENYSTDGSDVLVKKLCEKYDNVTYFTPNQPAKSFGENVAELIDRIDPNADYVHIASSDDLWHHDFVEKMIAFHEKYKNSNLAGIYSDRILINENNKIIGATGNLTTPNIISFDSNYTSFKHFSQGVVYLIAATFFRADFVRSLASLGRKTENSFDWIIMLEASRLGNIGYLDKALMRYRLHTSNTSKLKMDYNIYLDIYADYLIDVDKNAHSILNEIRAKQNQKSIELYSGLEKSRIKLALYRLKSKWQPIIKYYIQKIGLISFFRQIKFNK